MQQKMNITYITHYITFEDILFLFIYFYFFFEDIYLHTLHYFWRYIFLNSRCHFDIIINFQGLNQNWLWMYSWLGKYLKCFHYKKSFWKESRHLNCLAFELKINTNYCSHNYCLMTITIITILSIYDGLS